MAVLDTCDKIVQEAGALEGRDSHRATRQALDHEDGHAEQPVAAPACNSDGGQVGETEREPAVATDELEAVREQLEPACPPSSVEAPYDCMRRRHTTEARGQPRRPKRVAAVAVLRLSTDHAARRPGNVRPVAEPVRVLIVDDHAVVRSGLRLLLDANDDIEVVGEAGTARDAVFRARELKPDVILMDVMMPDQSGIEALPQLLHEHPEMKVLILSMQDDPRYVREAFAAGASGYVLKEAADTEVVAAVRELAKGGRYVNPELGARLVAAEAAARRQAEADPLSDREREVLRLLALGHTNQEIAKQLFISVRTAETHRAHIMQKLRLSTRAELVRHAIAQGLLAE